MVNSGVASEVPELKDVLDRLGGKEKPPVDGGLPAVTLDMVRGETIDYELVAWLNERKNRRAIRAVSHHVATYRCATPAEMTGCRPSRASRRRSTARAT